MRTYTIVAKVPAKGDSPARGPVSAEVEFPESFEEAIEKGINEKVILSNAFAKWKITLQANMRSWLKKGLTGKEIQERISRSVIGMPSERAVADPQQMFINKFRSASPEEQAKMLEMLRAAAAEA